MKIHQNLQFKKFDPKTIILYYIWVREKKSLLRQKMKNLRLLETNSVICKHHRSLKNMLAKYRLNTSEGSLVTYVSNRKYSLKYIPNNNKLCTVKYNIV